ncbi:glycosyltransferase, partial [Proteus mirabilis]
MISIISPILGNPSKVKTFISSFLDNTQGQFKLLENIELIIIDDGSEVNLKETVKAFTQKFDERKWRLIFLRNEKNEGRAFSRNKAAKFATCEWLFFVDIDNLLQQGCLKKLYSIVLSSKVPLVVRANVRCWPKLTSTSNYLHYFDSRYLGSRYAGTVKIEYRYFASDAFLINKSVFDSLQGFDESFRHYGCEDEEFGARLRAKNIPYFFCSDALLYDNDSPTLDRACARMIPYARYSVPILIRKHPTIIDKLLFPQAENLKNIKSAILKGVLYCAN